MTRHQGVLPSVLKKYVTLIKSRDWVKYSRLSENLFLLLEKQFRGQEAHIKAPNLPGAGGRPVTPFSYKKGKVFILAPPRLAVLLGKHVCKAST